jgi:hypothetical protein
MRSCGHAVLAVLGISLAACGSSASSGSSAPEPTGPLTPPVVTPACTTPKHGIYELTLAPKTSCPWWTHSESDHATMHITDTTVRYPFSDDVCGPISVTDCTVRNDCSPMKLDPGPGPVGVIVKASTVFAYTDDKHATGSIRFDSGDPCIMQFDFTARSLF